MNCGFLRNGWPVHVPGHTEDCPTFQWWDKPRLPWTHPDADPLGDVREHFTRAIAHQPNPLLQQALYRLMAGGAWSDWR